MSTVAEPIVQHRDGGRHSTARLAAAPPPIDDEPSVAAGSSIADAFRTVEKGSPAEQALVDLVQSLASHAGNGGGSQSITRAWLGRLVGVVLAVLALGQPVVEQVAERAISPSTALERKMDEALSVQAAMQRSQADMQATFTAFAAWVIQAEQARSQGNPPPDLPVAVRFLLVQDELARDSGL